MRRCKGISGYRLLRALTKTLIFDKNWCKYALSFGEFSRQLYVEDRIRHFMRAVFLGEGWHRMTHSIPYEI